uniref:UDP-glucose glucosyltransferase n=1 Tax=Catharanthus roseus TaxID=4058 RepID=C5NN16_CATRO|nr:UDP-glucose glucosyltransferase [Catharanthus roseus]
MRVVLVPFPLQGHITPMLQLGSMLHSKGFSITIAHTDHNPPNPSNHPNFTFVNLPDQLGPNSNPTFHDLLPVILGINNYCREPLHKHLSEMIENQERDGGVVACVIHDPIMYFVDSVAKQLQIPSLILRTTSAAYLKTMRINVELHQEYKYTPLPESRLLEKVSNLEPLRFKDLPSPLHVRIPEFIIQLQRDLINKGSSVAFIWNTLDDLEGLILSELQEKDNIPFFSIGPFHKLVPKLSTTLIEEDKTCMEWLDKQSLKSVLYVSFGSLATLESKAVVEIARGLAQSEQPFLWVIRPGLIKGSKWIEDLPEGFQEEIGQRGLIVKWAPQRDVLSHFAIGAFWSHCGWNSIMESASQGVPLICKPCFSDQRVNAMFLTHVWKIGILLDDPLDRESIEKSIRRVMVDEEGKEIRENAMDFKQKVHASVQQGGDSNKCLNELTDFIASLVMAQKSNTNDG